jgi:hypothetical protein
MTGRACAQLLLMLVAAAGIGCGEDFDPYNRLNSLRVLAIASEPVAPAPSETTTLTPLVYTKQDEPVLTYAWSWCPLSIGADDSETCPIDEAQFGAVAAESGVAAPAYDLGSEPTASFTHVFAPELLEAFCSESFQGRSILDCEHGFPVQVKLIVTTQAETLVSVRTLHLGLADTSPNANPVIDGISIEPPDEQEQRLPDDAESPEPPQIMVPRSTETLTRAEVSPAAAEVYAGQDEDGENVTKRERLVFTWFVESGETDSVRTSFVPDRLPLPEALENLWKPAAVEDYPAATARLVVVVRDDRGGVGWRSGRVLLSEAP